MATNFAGSATYATHGDETRVHQYPPEIRWKQVAMQPNDPTTRPTAHPYPQGAVKHNTFGSGCHSMRDRYAATYALAIRQPHQLALR